MLSKQYSARFLDSEECEVLVLFEGLIILLACSVHLVRRRFGQLLWDFVKFGRGCRRTACTGHARKNIKPSKRSELYFLWISEVFISELQTHPNLHSPVWVGQSAAIPSAARCKFGCVFLHGCPYPGAMVRTWVCLIYAISTYSNPEDPFHTN